MDPNQKKPKPSTSYGYEGDDTNPQLNQPHNATGLIRTGNEGGVIIVPWPAQQSGQGHAESIPEATGEEQVGLQTLGNEGSTQGLLRKKLTLLIKRAGYDILHFNEDKQALAREILDLKMEDYDLDTLVRETKEKIKILKENGNIKRWQFFTTDDLKSLPCLQNEMLFVVKGPPDITAASDPSGQKLIFSSTSGVIDVYLTSEYQEILQIHPGIVINIGQQAPVIPEPVPADVRGNEENSERGIIAPNHKPVNDDSLLVSDADAGISAETWTAPEIDWDEFELEACVANENASVPFPSNDARENDINPRTAWLNASAAYNSDDDSQYQLLFNDEPSLTDLWIDSSMTRDTTARDNPPSLDEALRKKPSEDDDTRN